MDPRKSSRQRRACASAAAACALLAVASANADAFRSLSVEEAIQALQRRGLQVVYSSDVVQPSMRVQAEPSSTEPVAILQEILRPHGVVVHKGPNGVLMLVRAEKPRAPNTRTIDALYTNLAPTIEEVIVSASHYEFLREPTLPLNFLSASDLQALPTLGEDPLRAAARVPGTASGDFSAKLNVRGGEADETLVRFDNLRLQNPFHLKDFQSTFSSIEPGVISGMRVYTGGFPVSFGDRMSAVIDIDTLTPPTPGYTELALSFFNTSALTAGRTADNRGEWLLSGRRGNLDLLIGAINPSIGHPSYLDLYGRVGRQLGESWTLSANVMAADDVIALYDGNNREEQARAEYRDAYYWLRADYQPSAALSGNVLLARSSLDSERLGSAHQGGIAAGRLSDERAFAITSLQSDWSARLRDDLLLQFGAEWQGMNGRYDYSDEVEYHLLFDLRGASQESTRSRTARVRPSGDRYGAYVNVRIEPTAKFATEAGLRWDRETLSADASDELEPRIGALYRIGERTRLRASWGRYVQTQSIDELPVSDGETEFSTPQRAEHWIASIEHAHENGLEWRLEAYRKNYRHIRPRFENLLNNFVLLPELKPDRIRIAPRRARATGVELSLHRKIGPSLSWSLSYAWSSVEDDIDGVWTARSWDQPHALNGALIWRNDRWELSLAGTYHSGWPTSAVQLETTAGKTPVVTVRARNDRHMGAYRTLDARAARKIEFGSGGTFTVFMEVNNLLNTKNDCCLKYEFESGEDGDPVGLDVNKRSYLPLTPSLGFTWRF